MKHHTTWKHTEKRDTYVKIKEGNDGPYGMPDIYPGEYGVVVKTPIERKLLKHSNQQPRVFSNKDEARKAAVDWMRDHPNP